jgi:hypothetical protein
VLTLSPGQWDAGTLYSNCVVYVGGTYFLYYAAAATSNYWIGAQIGVATSTDGVHWTKYSGNPIIQANSSELWKNSIVNPAVCYVSGTFYMIYTGIMSNYTSAACLATSTDGLHFTEYSGNPVLDDNSAWISRYMENCGGGLSYFDGYFYSYYCKQYKSMSMRCTGVARSTDCITWTTCAQNPVLTTSEAGYGTGSAACLICGSVIKWGTQYLYLFCGGTSVSSPSGLNLDAVISPTPWFNSSREWSPAQNLFKPSSGIDCIALVQTLDADGNTIAYQNNLTITYTNGVSAYHAFWVDGGASGCIPFSDSFGNGNGWQRNGPGNWRVNNGAIENNGNTINDVYLYSNLNTGNIRVGATLSAPTGKYYNAYIIARASGMGSNTNCYGVNFRAYNPGGGYGPDVRLLKDVNSLGWNGGGEHFISGPVSAVLPNGANVEFRVYGTTSVTLEGYLNGVKVINITDSGQLYGSPFTSGLFGLQAWEQNAANGVSDYSNIYVTKFVSPEPSHGLWGSQEGYLLTVSTVGSGSVTVNNTDVNIGDVVLLTAVPDEGWSFSTWSGNLTGSTNPATLTITSNMIVTATFTFTPGLGWLNGWQYRKIHAINGVATALTDYQISITLHYGSGTDLAGDAYLDSHCRSDFGDVRFTGPGGTTLLNYWFEQIVPGTQATVWIKIPSIPASPGKTSIYVYYENPTATNVSNGKNTFIDFYGGGEGWTGFIGGGEVSNATIPSGFTSTTYAALNSTVYYPIPQGASGSWDEKLHTFQPVHKTNITEVNMDGYKFWAYYCDIYGYGVGLARSNDLINWDKYSGNPLPGLYGSSTYYRWPSVTLENGVFNMFLDDYPLYDGYLNFIKRYNSTDGINFSYVETVYSVPGSNYEVECPYIWFNPNDNKYYLYFTEKNQTRTPVSMTECLSATTLDGLKNASLIDAKPNNNDEYAPSVLYDPSTGLYWLTNEQGQSWNERAFHSTSPISGFVEASNSPILTDLDACGMQFWHNNKVYFYYNHQLSGSWAGPWDTRLQIQAEPGISPEAGSYRMVDASTTVATPLEGQFSTHTTNFTLEYKTKNVWAVGKQLVDYIGVNAAVHFGACLGRNPADTGSSWWYHNVPHSLSWTQLPATLVQGQWYSIKRLFDFANHKEWVYINGVAQGYYSWVEWDGPVNSISYAWFALGESELGSMWLDVFRTRQYVSAEPSQGSWGSEEQSMRTLIYIDPPLTEKTFGDVGTDFWVNVAVEDIADLWGFDFNVTWDNTLITLVGVDFNTTLDAMYGVDGWFVASNETSLGYYQLAAVGLNAGFTSTGTAPLATLQFHVENPPNNGNWQTPLHFVTDKLSNSTWSPITHTVGDGLYKITGKAPTLTTIPTSKTCRTYNETFTVAINISDASNVEDFRFEIRYNATLLDVAGVSWNAWGGTCTADEVNGILTGYASGSAVSGNMTLLTITFNVTYHHIWKDESTVSGWTNIQTGTVYFQWANLSYASGPDLAYVKGGLNQINVGPDFAYTFSPIRGDIDNNGQVNVFDVRTVAAFYDTINSDYNLTGDPIIDIYDLVIVGSNFGYTYIP